MWRSFQKHLRRSASGIPRRRLQSLTWSVTDDGAWPESFAERPSTIYTHQYRPERYAQTKLDRSNDCTHARTYPDVSYGLYVFANGKQQHRACFQNAQ